MKVREIVKGCEYIVRFLAPLFTITINFEAMARAKKNLEARRQRISDMLRAHVAVKTIMEITGASSASIYKLKAKLEAGKSVESVVKHKSKPTPNKKLTPAFLADLKARYTANPSISMRKMAKIVGVGEKTIRRGVKELGMASKVRPRRQLLTGKQKEKRTVRSKKILSALKKKTRSTVLICSDKKMFYVDQAYNRRNDRVVVDKDAEVTPVMKTKHPQGVMMLGVVASDGKRMPPYFFPEGLKIGTEVYLRVMRTVVKPWIEANYPDGNYIWQQDNAPGHASNKTQRWIVANLPGAWTKEFWPPSSPDANPLDYSIWSVIEAKACATPHPNLTELKASITREWAAMTDSYVVKTFKAFRPRIEAIIEAEGGHIEGKKR